MSRASLARSIAFACAFGAAQAAAQSAQRLPEVTVRGETSRASATAVTEDVAASPASVTVLERAELDRKTVTTYGDLFRGLTGINVLEYGQGLVAYDVQMRGFDGGHGRNIAVFLDGVPLNITGSQHTNGYMDLAQVIPEILNRVEIVRGPFSVFAGNHAVAGSIQLTTDAAVGSGFKASIDTFGRARALPIANLQAGPGKLLVALDATKGAAYTKQSDLERLNLFTRYSVPLADGLASVRVQLYDADAQAPGYIDRDRARSGVIDKRGFLSRGIGDAKRQQNLVFNYRSDDLDGARGWRGGWFASLYFVNDDRRRWTNFDLATPMGSDAELGAERDRLRQFGFDARKTTSFPTFGLPSQFVAGLQWNDERVRALNFRAGPDQSQLNVPGRDTIGADRVVQTRTRAVYAQYQLQPIARLKITAAARYDHLDFDIRLRADDDSLALAQNAGVGDTVRQSASRVSPKLGVGYTLVESSGQLVDLYANAARGLKSPYAYSDFFTNLAATRTVPDLSISSLTSYEGGLQGGAKDGRWRWRASLWSTRQERESDRNTAGVFASFKKTERDGYDLEGSVNVARRVQLFANWSQVRARIREPITPGADRIPNVPASIGTVGMNAAFNAGANRFDTTLAISRVGPQSITSDDTLRTRAYYRALGRAAYTRSEWKGAAVFLNVIAYNRQFDELAFDFGGGLVGVSPRPRLAATVGVQVPL